MALVSCGTWLAIVSHFNVAPLQCAEREGKRPELIRPDGAVDSSSIETAPTYYRRIFVPADNVETWPRGGEKFLPIESRDFDAWRTSANVAATATATIREARYTARLDGDQLVECRGEWKFDVRDNGPAFFPLGDTSIRVRDAKWRHDQELPVRIGAWGESGGPADLIGLEVPRVDTLRFTWQAPTRLLHSGLEVAWRLPVAAVARLVLELPKGKEPLVDRGAVLAKRDLPQDADTGNGNFLQWELALDPSSSATLRIVDTDRSATQFLAPTANWREEIVTSTAPTLREDMRYFIRQRGLELGATWHIDATASELRELAVRLPTDLHFISAVAGAQHLPWRIETERRTSDRFVVIELPKSTNLPLKIAVSGWHPLLLDRSWRLPVLRPRGVFWQSGTIQLSIDPQLELQALGHKECVQTGISRPDAEQIEPETSHLIMYAPSAELDVRITHRTAQSKIRLGSSLALADPDINGRQVSEWETSHGSLHKLTGELAPGWVIEAVETTPVEALGEWFIDARGNRRRITIQLARAARPGREISVVITGRLQRQGAGDPIAIKTLRMVDWNEGSVTRHVLTFQTVEPYAVETSGHLPAVRGEALSDDDRALVKLPTGKEAVFELAQASEDAALKLTLERGQYDADIRVDAACIERQIAQNYHLTIHPTTNGVDRLLVYFTGALSKDVRWTEKSTNAPLSAERLGEDDPRQVGLPTDGQLWLVRLPGLTTKTIEIVAAVVTPWPARKALPLLAMPEAVEQRGRVVVYADAANMPLLASQGMQSTALPVDPIASSYSDGLPSARAAYRYDPMSCLSEPGRARLWIESSTTKDFRSLIARHVELESFYWSSGRAVHRASYELQNEDAANFQPPVPANAIIRAVLLNGQALEQSIGDRSERPTSIALGAGNRSALVSIHFETQQSPLAAGGKLQPPIAVEGIPILEGRWTIWLPEGYSAVDAENWSAGHEYHWRRRLFGPLGRSSQQRVFNPLRSRDWSRLLGPLGSTSATAMGENPNRLGWTAYRTRFVAGAPDAVRVAHPPAIASWAIAVFLISVWGGRRLHGRGGALVALLAIAAASALVLPAAFAPVATGVFLGLLCSLILRWPRPVTSGYAEHHSWSRLSTVSMPSILLSLMITALARAEPARDDSSMQQAQQVTSIERVFIPVDSDGAQAGSKVYLSEQFLRKLLRSQGRHDATSRQWLLVKAAYTGELLEQTETSGVIAGEWTMNFDIEVLARDTTVSLPLVRDEAAWQDTAMLDGVPMPLRWRDDGRGCEVNVSEPGRYGLAISCVPRTTAESRQNSMSLSIPPIADSRVRLEYPKTLAGLIATGAEATTRIDGQPEWLDYELDASRQLEVQWPDSSWTAGAIQNLRVTGLRWLRIGVDGVELEVKYVIEGNARRPDSLSVVFDRRWEPVTDHASAAGITVEDARDNRRSIHVPLPPDDIDRQEISLRWRLTGTVVWGRLRLPRVELISIPVAHQWLAISTDAEVECEIIDGAASPGTVNEFLALWGDADDTPRLVQGNVRTSAPLSVAVRPRQRESTIDELLHIAAGRNQLRVAYQADVTPGTEHKYQFQIVVPADFSIDEVVVREESRRIPVRWARVDEKRVNVFFSEQVANEYRLTLRGTVPSTETAERPLPRVTALAMDATSQDVQLYRDEHVLVEVNGLTQAEQLPERPRELPPAAWTVRPVAVYRLDENAFQRARLSTTPNNVGLAGPTLLTLNREHDVWSAGFTGQWTVEHGNLDTLRLRAPATWAGPFSIESEVPATMEFETAESAGPMLLIRFTESVREGESVNFTVRGVMAPSGQGLVAVPDITPAPHVRGKRFLQAPLQLDGQPLAWSDAGVRPADLPVELRDISSVLHDAPSFEITDSPFHMVMQPAARQAAARVRLADTTVWASDSDAQLIATRLVVEAPDVEQCLIRLPRGQDLVSVRLEGNQALIQPVGAQRWHVTVGPSELPQVLEIVSTARASIEDGRTLRRPTLLSAGKPIPVELSLWSIGLPPTTPRLRSEAAKVVAETEQAAVRLDRLVSIAEAATPSAAEAPAPDGRNWYRPWAAWLVSLRQEALENLSGPVPRSSLIQVSRPNDEQLTRASQRLDRWMDANREQMGWDEPDATQQSALGRNRFLTYREDSDPPLRWTYCVAEGGDNELTVAFATTGPTPRQMQALSLLAIAAAAAAAVWLIRQPVALDSLFRWPHAVTFLLGIAFWAWLWPSWLGILIAAGSLILAWRIGWPGRNLPMERSTVLRVSRRDAAAP